MHSRTSICSVKADAGPCLGVIGDFRAATQVHGLVRFAGRDHLYTACTQQRSQPNFESQVGILLQLPAGEMAAHVISAMGGIQHHDEARRRRGRSARSRRRLLLEGTCGFCVGGAWAAVVGVVPSTARYPVNSRTADTRRRSTVSHRRVRKKSKGWNTEVLALSGPPPAVPRPGRRNSTLAEPGVRSTPVGLFPDSEGRVL